MGTQFWWFYDVIAAVIVLACIFIWGKKGVIKSILALTSCLLAAIISFGISSGIAKTIYGSSVRVSNIKKISNNIDNDTFLHDYTAYLESLGYSIKVNQKQLDEIFNGSGDYTEEICRYVNSINGRAVEKNEETLRRKVREGYTAVISGIVSDALKNNYVTEVTVNTINEKGDIDELIPLIADHDVQRDAAEYIVDNFTADAYNSLFRLGTVLVLFLLLAILIGFIMRSFTANQSEMDLSLGNHIAGGAIAILTGGVFIFAAAVIVRLWAILGNNEMMFFNSDVVDKTYIFKYFYDFIMKM